MTIEPRAICAGCGRPPAVCWCAQAVALRTRTRVVILQHPREARVAIGTVAIAARCLPDAIVARDVDFPPERLDALLHGDPARPPVLLFPTDDARDLRADPFPHDVTLVLLDGTWTLAAKLLKRNAALRELPRVRFTPSAPSRYRIRREPAEHCVASIEALAEALGVLESDPARYAQLLAPFEAMVDHQIRCAVEQSPRRRTRPHGPAPVKHRRPSPLEVIDPARVVLAYGEASAWPRGTPDAPADELLHQVAYRPRDGATLELFIQPTRPVASSFYHHAELPRDALDGAVPRDELAARWRDFAGDAEAVLTWGAFATDLLAAEGISLPRRIDLRAEAAMRRHARPGALEDLAPGAPPLGMGRAGRRLGALAAVYASLRG